MITIEGAKVKAKMIPREKIFSIWKMLTRKPFPRVAAFQLEDNDFDFAIKLRKCRDDEQREIEEWGRVLSRYQYLNFICLSRNVRVNGKARHKKTKAKDNMTSDDRRLATRMITRSRMNQRLREKVAHKLVHSIE